MNVKTTVGERVRALREERRLSQRELAAKAGVSTNAISLIERDASSPSVATLQSLAGALNVKMSYFFEYDEYHDVLVVRGGKRPFLDGRGARIESVGESLQRQEMEPFLVTLLPGSGSGERQVVHTGHEFVYCLQGVVEYVIDGNIYSLKPDDMMLFEAHLPHLWRNPGKEEARFLLVLQTPDQSNEPIQRHFSSFPSLTHIG